MKHSDTLGAIAPALVAALGKIEGAAKTKANPGFKGTKYADLETVINSSRDILTEHGLTIIQLPGACVSGVMNLETIIMHESGEWISGEMGIALGKTDPQGVGSAITYARRYAQMAALNMPAVDDDGEAAMGRGRVHEPAPPAQTRHEEPKPLTLAERSAALVKRLNVAKTAEELRKAYSLGSKLCSELDMKDPERLVEINTLYETRFAELSEQVAA